MEIAGGLAEVHAARAARADIDRPLTFEAMADDVAALMRHLGIERANSRGLSLGAQVALQTAIRHPELVAQARGRLGSLQAAGMVSGGPA